MKTKHTPGPWHIEETDDTYFIADANSEICGGVEKLRDDEFIDRAEANARLIAAAPELLGALIVANRNMSHRKGDCFSDDYMGACVCGKGVVEAAIAKATGGTP